jgi:hypothetical protein
MPSTRHTACSHPGMRMPLTSVFARIALLLVLAITASGCELVGGIFKAGMWIGALGVVAVVALVLVAVMKLKR